MLCLCDKGDPNLFRGLLDKPLEVKCEVDDREEGVVMEKANQVCVRGGGENK